MTPDEAFKIALANLPHFSPEQKAKLLLFLKQQKAQAAVEEKPEIGDDWLFKGICSAMKQKGLISGASTYGATRTNGYKKYLAAREELIPELELLLPTRNRSQSRLSLAMLVGNALIKWCARADGEKPSPGYILANAVHSLEALELCFPGYISSNMFHIVLGGFEAKDRVD